MVTALAGDTSCHEVPESNPAVVAAGYSEHCPSPVELGYEGFGSTLLNIAITENSRSYSPPGLPVVMETGYGG